MDTLVRFLADGLLLIIIAVAGLLAGYYFLLRHRELIQQKAPYAIMAGLTSLLLGKLISLVYQPAVSRPYIEQGLSAGASYIDNPGFPSDHVLLGTVIVVMIFALTPFRKTSYLLGGLVVAMALGRVLALVHTPADVIAGATVGIMGGLWYLALPKSKTS